MELSVFEKIARRELPGYIVWEDDTFIAFLSIGPFVKGHTLVVPKENWGAELFELADDRYSALMVATQKVAQLLKKKLDCARVLEWVEGFEVPHVHVHLFPVAEGQGLRSMEPLSLTPEEFEAVRDQIIG